MAITANQHVAVHSIENVMLTIGIIRTTIFRQKTKTQKFFMNLFFCSQTGIVNIWLNKYGTNITISVLGKPDHAIGTCIKIPVVSINSLKERREIVVRISEIIQLDDFTPIR